MGKAKLTTANEIAAYRAGREEGYKAGLEFAEETLKNELMNPNCKTISPLMILVNINEKIEKERRK